MDEYEAPALPQVGQEAEDDEYELELLPPLPQVGQETEELRPPQVGQEVELE
ncbi:hypothetical protein FACS189427_10380 [Planctomycetales bacterium]|nr:hypothetical protein FACS189427_10380 [Planctomycetales bacterium]